MNLKYILSQAAQLPHFLIFYIRQVNIFSINIEIFPIFYLVQKESKETWRNMYRGGNMGIGMDIIVSPDVAEDILDVSESFGLMGQIIGKCEKSREGNKLTIQSSLGNFQYP